MERNRLLAGRYRFLRLLPGRAKGATWTALDEATGASVVASFWPAARVAASHKAAGIKHERLARIVDFVHKFTPQDIPENTEAPKDAAVAVAEWMQGVTLHERLRTVRTAVESVQILAQVASVVSSIHEGECVHGAVSSRTVLLQRSDGGPTPAVTQVLVPPDGACFSPERVRGGGVSMPDDVWALHVILYMALTAQRPFTGGAAPELARAIVAAKPPPLAAFDAGDDELQRLLDRGFGPASKRMRSAEELVAELNGWIARKRPVSPRKASVGQLLAQQVEEPGPPSIDAASLQAYGQRFSRPEIGDVVDNVANLVRDPPPPSIPAPYDDDDAKTELVQTPFFERADEPAPRGKPAAAPRPQAGPAVVSGKVIPRAKPADAPIEPKRVIDAGRAADKPAGPAKPTSQETPPPAKRTTRDSEPPTIAVSTPERRPLFVAMANAAPPAAEDAALTPAMPAVQDAAPARAAAAQVTAARPSLDSAPEPLPEPGSAPPPAPDGAVESPEPLTESGADAKDPTPVPGVPPPRAASVPPPPAAAQPAAPASRRSRTPMLIGGGVLAAAAVALGAYAFFSGHPDAAMDPGTIKPRASESASAAASSSAQAAPSASAPPAASQSAQPAASASAPASDASACIAALFPPDTFAGVQPDLGFVCEEPDVRKGSPRMRSRIVFASRGALTQGMDEWSRLGWYELVVWATLRGACCGSGALIELPETSGACEPLAPAVQDTARALVARDRDLAEQKLALFEKSGMCLQFGETKPFKYTSPPRSGGQVVFGKFMTRTLSRP
jgi:hypothetical protein